MSAEGRARPRIGVRPAARVATYAPERHRDALARQTATLSSRSAPRYEGGPREAKPASREQSHPFVTHAMHKGATQRSKTKDNHRFLTHAMHKGAARRSSTQDSHRFQTH
jgi:hypothetical protein